MSTLSLKVQKKTEKINEDLLSETSESKGIWDSIVRYVKYCTTQSWFALVSFKTFFRWQAVKKFSLFIYYFLSDWLVCWYSFRLSITQCGFRRSYSSPGSRLQYYAVRSSLAKNMCFCRYVCAFVCFPTFPNCVILSPYLMLAVWSVWSTFEKR